MDWSPFVGFVHTRRTTRPRPLVTQTTTPLSQTYNRDRPLLYPFVTTTDSNNDPLRPLRRLKASICIVTRRSDTGPPSSRKQGRLARETGGPSRNQGSGGVGPGRVRGVLQGSSVHPLRPRLRPTVPYRTTQNDPPYPPPICVPLHSST